MTWLDLTNQFDFTSVTYLRINRGLFISHVLFDLTILVISICFSHAPYPWRFNVSLAIVTVFVTIICYDKKSQDQL